MRRVSMDCYVIIAENSQKWSYIPALYAYSKLSILSLGYADCFAFCLSSINPWPYDITIACVMLFNNHLQWETEANHELLGYRAIWHILRRDYGLKVKKYVINNYFC